MPTKVGSAELKRVSLNLLAGRGCMSAVPHPDTKLPEEANGFDESPLASPSPEPGQLFWRLVPAFDSLRHYSWRACSADGVAGLTVAAVAVPQAMAYASIVGIPPQYGLYTA